MGDWQAAAPQAITSAHSHEEAPAPQAEAAQGGPGARGPARDDAEAHACCPKEEVTRGSERTALRWSGVSARCQGQGGQRWEGGAAGQLLAEQRELPRQARGSCACVETTLSSRCGSTPVCPAPGPSPLMGY